MLVRTDSNIFAQAMPEEKRASNDGAGIHQPPKKSALLDFSDALIFYMFSFFKIVTLVRMPLVCKRFWFTHDNKLWLPLLKKVFGQKMVIPKGMIDPCNIGPSHARKSFIECYYGCQDSE